MTWCAGLRQLLLAALPTLALRPVQLYEHQSGKAEEAQGSRAPPPPLHGLRSAEVSFHGDCGDIIPLNAGRCRMW
jgi:hypothetical protein